MKEHMNAAEPPAPLPAAFELLASKLIPLAAQAGQIPSGTTIAELTRPQPADTGDVRSMLATLAQLLAMAALSWKHDRDKLRSAELTAAAIDFAQFSHGYVSHACGVGASEALQAARSAIAKAAAHARHAPTRDARALVQEWWRVNGEGRMTKEAAADAIVAGRLVSESRRTVRGWLVGL